MESPSAEVDSQAMFHDKKTLYKFSKKKVGEITNPLLESSNSRKGSSQDSNVEAISSRGSIEAIPARESEPLEDSDYQLGKKDQGKEFGCKYCSKKFTNKQALGGHQNAHKLERAMEKTARVSHLAKYRYLAGGSSSYSGLTSPFPGCFNRSNEFLNGAAVTNRPFHSQNPVQRGMHVGRYSRPMQPMAHNPFAPRPIPGYSRVNYPGLGVNAPRIPQFTATPLHVQNLPLNLQLSALRTASSCAVHNPGRLRTVPELNSIPDRNPGGQNNNQLNDSGNEQLDNSGLDLTLRL